jgi:hypothetical protein
LEIKQLGAAGHPWLTQEAKIRRIAVQIQPRKIVLKKPYHKKLGWWRGSSPSTTKTKQNKKLGAGGLGLILVKMRQLSKKQEGGDGARFTDVWGLSSSIGNNYKDTAWESA